VPTPGPNAPEQRARQQIDAALAAAGWAVQNRDEVNLAASRGVAIREFVMVLAVPQSLSGRAHLA
jgi:hypothetical protein